MKKSLKLPIAFSFVFLLCMAFQCGVEKEEIDYTYRFAETIDLVPAQKSYLLGDTIWVQYANPQQELFDATTNQNVSAESVSIDFEIFFNARYQAPVNPADGFCDFVTEEGHKIARPSGHYGAGLFQTVGCNNEGYDLKVGIVPKHTGIYSLELRHIGPPAQVKACANRPAAFPASSIAYTFNLADVNKDVYLGIPPQARGESVNGLSESRVDSKKVYMVKVE
jgi:hypothetical protein